MRNKLLQHTLSAVIAAWAISMAQGPAWLDSTALAGPMASQALVLAMR
jgi:hypothetical protein